jgi:hypothetical protein
MSEQPSIEAELRKIRHARSRAWLIYLVTLFVALCTWPLSFQFQTPWNFALFPILPSILALIGYFQVDGLCCPRCGLWFFGNWFDHRGIYFSSSCQQCGLHL